MEVSCRRAFAGYKRKDVENIIASIGNELDSSMRGYEKEKNRLSEENQILRNEIYNTECELENLKSVRRQLESILYYTYLETCMRLYETKKHYDEVIQSKTQILREQQDINNRIRSSTDTLIEQIRLVAGGKKDEEL